MFCSNSLKFASSVLQLRSDLYFLFCVAVLDQIIQSGCLLDSSLHCSHGNITDLTAALWRGLHYQRSPCGFGSRSPPVAALRAPEAVCVPRRVPGCSRGALRHPPVSSSGTKKQECHLWVWNWLESSLHVLFKIKKTLKLFICKRYARFKLFATFECGISY